MEYLIQCECGKRLAVMAGSAGASLPCGCGRSVRVPALSELRAQQGLPAYPRVDAEPAQDTSLPLGFGARVLLIAGGGLLLMGGFFLFLGNRSGAFPTFPFAGFITMAIG
jgi:hypothetical protein